jgi:ubiquinone/menaquinone biosynthesis C-methylase UbiE
MNYNFIAPYYHSLSKLIFLNQQHKAHFLILDQLKDGDKILWVGGGAGKFIPEIDRLNLEIEIDYVDFSSKMIELAKKLKTTHVYINFITADIFNYKTENKYDVIITTFLFDHFTQQQAETLFERLYLFLKPNSIWFYVDFTQNQSKWQKQVTQLMLSFFRIVIGLNINQLPKMNLVFEEKMKVYKTQKFFQNYIESIIYRNIT